jgi:hypothetical protein
MTKRSEILIAARTIIADPERWTQGHLARDSEGEIRRPDEPEACKFCAYGAVLYAAHRLGAHDREGPLTGQTLDVAAKKIKPEEMKHSGSLRPIAYLNDYFGDTSRKLVLDAYNLAIQIETARENATEIER